MVFDLLKRIFGTQQTRTVRKYFKIVQKINREEEKLQPLSDDAIRAKTAEFRTRLQNGETTDDLMVEAYAVVKNVCRRLVGTDVHVSGYDQKWDMIPYDVQIVGAIAMHHQTICDLHFQPPSARISSTLQTALTARRQTTQHAINQIQK